MVDQGLRHRLLSSPWRVKWSAGASKDLDFGRELGHERAEAVATAVQTQPALTMPAAGVCHSNAPSDRIQSLAR
jgi:hypothetical protein